MPQSAHGHGYGLFGQGNCCYFAADFVERFWPMRLPISSKWDAAEWARLDGHEAGGYTVMKTDQPGSGDIFVLPRSSDYPRGHVGVVIGSYIDFDFDTGDRLDHLVVLESFMYTGEFYCPYLYNGCRYQNQSYPVDHFADGCFLTFCSDL